MSTHLSFSKVSIQDPVQGRTVYKAAHLVQPIQELIEEVRQGLQLGSTEPLILTEHTGLVADRAIPEQLQGKIDQLKKRLFGNAPLSTNSRSSQSPFTPPSPVEPRAPNHHGNGKGAGRRSPSYASKILHQPSGFEYESIERQFSIMQELQEQNGLLREQSHKLLQEVSGLRQQTDELATHHELQIQALNAKLDEMARDPHLHQDTLKTFREQEAHIQALEEQLQQKEDENARLHGQLESQKSQHQAKIHEYQQTINQLQSDLNKTNENLSKLTENYCSVRDERDRYDQTISQQRETIHDLEQTIEEQIQSYSAFIGKIQQDNEKLSHYASRLTAALQKKNESLTIQDQSLKQLMAEKAALKKQLALTTTHLKEAKESLSDQYSQIKELTNQRKDLERKLEHASGVIEGLQEKLTEAHSQLETFTDLSINALVEKDKEIAALTATQRGLLSAVQRDSAEKAYQIDELSAENAQLKEAADRRRLTSLIELDDDVKQREALKARIAQLEHDLEEEQLQKAFLLKQRDHLAGTIEKLQEQLYQSETEKAQLVKALEASLARVSHYKNRVFIGLKNQLDLTKQALAQEKEAHRTTLANMEQMHSAEELKQLKEKANVEERRANRHQKEIKELRAWKDYWAKERDEYMGQYYDLLEELKKASIAVVGQPSDDPLEDLLKTITSLQTQLTEAKEAAARGTEEDASTIEKLQAERARMLVFLRKLHEEISMDEVPEEDNLVEDSVHMLDALLMERRGMEQKIAQLEQASNRTLPKEMITIQKQLEATQRKTEERRARFLEVQKAYKYPQRIKKLEKERVQFEEERAAHVAELKKQSLIIQQLREQISALKGAQNKDLLARLTAAEEKAARLQHLDTSLQEQLREIDLKNKQAEAALAALPLYRDEERRKAKAEYLSQVDYLKHEKALLEKKIEETNRALSQRSKTRSYFDLERENLKEQYERETTPLKEEIARLKEQAAGHNRAFHNLTKNQAKHIRKIAELEQEVAQTHELRQQLATVEEKNQELLGYHHETAEAQKRVRALEEKLSQLSLKAAPSSAIVDNDEMGEKLIGVYKLLANIEQKVPQKAEAHK